MSNYHILDKSINGKTVNCVFHIAIPDSANSVGTNWRDAVMHHFNPVPVLSWNNAAENLLIEAGAVWEVSKTVRFSTTDLPLTDAQKLAEVEAFYIDEQAAALEKLADMLDFFDHEGDV